MKTYKDKCTICGSEDHSIAFKGGFVCDSCVKHIRAMPECNLHDKEACPHSTTSYEKEYPNLHRS